MFFKKALEKASIQGWHEGFDTGRKKAVHETRKVIIKLLNEELANAIGNKQSATYIKGIERSIEIIRKGKR